MSKWALNNQRVVALFIAILTLGGLVSYYALPKLEDPEIVVRQAVVVGIYPGASSHQVELEVTDVLEKKWENKEALREQLGLSREDGSKIMIGLVSRLTDQKGLDLVDAIMPEIMDGRTQVIVLGTGDPRYENAFRYYEEKYPGDVCAYISYNEGLAHRIYAGTDAFLVPSLFEPCGLTQLIAMRYGTIPIVRETGGLKDTVLPYDEEAQEGNGFTFVTYTPDHLLEAVDSAKDLFFGDRQKWDAMVKRDMMKDVSWEQSAKQYLEFYKELMA